MKMKKIFRMIAVLVCMLTVVSAPTYAYAWTMPVCTCNLPDAVVYEYQSGPEVIQPNDDVMLTNYVGQSSGAFAVPANKTPFFAISCYTNTPYYVQIYMFKPAFAVVYESVITTGSTGFTIPAIAYDRTLIIDIRPIGNQPVLLSGYRYLYY